MDAFDAFVQELYDLLSHLHDPDYQPAFGMYAVLHCDPREGASAVQAGIMRTIESLKPPSDVPPTALARRDFDILHHRFVLKLTQEQSAECLDTSVRSLRRVQRAATHRLARVLWEHGLAHEATSLRDGAQTEVSSQSAAPEAQTPDWRVQVRENLSALQQSAPGAIADVEETLRSVLDMEGLLTSRHGVILQVGSIPPDLQAAIHISALRQILIMVVAQLASSMQQGLITIDITLEERDVLIALSAPGAAQGEWAGLDLVREILASQGGSLDIRAGEAGAQARLRVPSAGRVQVLVIDDNEDSVHYYRRCTTGTRYRITHIAQGQSAMQTIGSIGPDVIVLDIMLPDVDGWELLAQMRRDPASHSIPVIVCSIVRADDLAAALGAVQCLPKPVRHRDFIQALDRAIGQTPA
jgi:CheY-like chemotaxis protein